MAGTFKQETSAEKLDSFLARNRTVFLTVLLVAVVAIIVASVAVVAIGKTKEKDIAKYDAIYYALTYNADSLSGDALITRQDTALTALVPLQKKTGVVGVRANALAAELYFQKHDYEQALVAWEKAGILGKKSYFAPLAYYNAAVSAENSNDLDKAVALYQIVADTKDTIYAQHAQFNIGRIQESKADYTAAAAAYNALNDTNPSSEWAALAKTRLIVLKTEGKLQ